MTKYIKADDVNNLYEVTWDATKALLSKSKLEAFTLGLKMAIEEIQKLPTVETTPVRKGKWIECEGRKNEYYCSECYDIWKSDRIKDMKYCPSCRAKMDEKKEFDCNDCYYSMQNCNDRSICCEDETTLCDDFEPVEERKAK